MKQMRCFVLMIGLFIVCQAGADTVQDRKVEDKLKIPGLTSYVLTESFKKNEPARALVFGAGGTCLGLYVFDGSGNCVAKDDVTEPRTADDCLAVWVPAEQQTYSIEVRNAGAEVNEFRLAVR